MLKLQKMDGRMLWVDPERVLQVEDLGYATRIDMGGEVFDVVTPAAQVAEALSLMRFGKPAKTPADVDSAYREHKAREKEFVDKFTKAIEGVETFGMSESGKEPN